MSRIIFTKIQENEKIYRIQTTVAKGSLSLVVFEEVLEDINIYKTPMILEQNLKKQADIQHINLKDYLNKLISIFEDPNEVKFKFHKNSLTVLETANSNLQTKYFCCDLFEVTDLSSFIGNLVDEFHSQKLDLESKQCELAEKYELSKKEVSEYKNKLNELVERRTIDDQVILGNFVSLINEKKRRIQHLTELLEAFRNDPSLANPAEVNITSNRKRKLQSSKMETEPPPHKPREEVSESEDSNFSNNDEYATDDEKINDDNEVKTELKTVASQHIINEYIFNESPPKILAPLPQISRNSKDIQSLASTSFSGTNKHKKKEETKVPSNDTGKKTVEASKSFDTPMVDINTQDWLDGLQ